MRARLVVAMGAALAGCNQSNSSNQNAVSAKPVQLAPLPADPVERAATCYAARIVTVPANVPGVPGEAPNEAAQFLLLSASTTGITEPTKVSQLQELAQAALPAVRQAGQAAAQVEACRAAYPAARRTFSGLGPDDRDTRMQCFALSMAMKQIYDQSPQVQGPSVAQAGKLFSTLDDRMTAELFSGGRGNPAEIAGLAMRGLAVAVGKGPVTQLLDACAKRYSP